MRHELGLFGWHMRGVRRRRTALLFGERLRHHDLGLLGWHMHAVR